MTPASQTPDGSRNHCPKCGALLEIEPSASLNVPCLHCGTHLGFVNFSGTSHIYPTGDPFAPTIRELAELIPETVARENNVAAVAKAGRELWVAMSEPEDKETRDKLQFILNCNIECIDVPQGVIDSLLEAYYSD
jgi:hypothetical protein